MELLQGLIQLYRQTFSATLASFIRCWVIALVILGYVMALIFISSLTGRLGMIGGIVTLIVNALIIGSILDLIEQAVQGARSIRLADIKGSFGKYFNNVIGLGFIIGVPLQLLQLGTQANPNGQLITMAISLLIFILLNPALEVIYLVRHDSPLDVMKESYEFILENWIEWFLPIAIILAPLGFQIFFTLSSQIGQRAGLDFSALIIIPVTVVGSWFKYLGLSGVLSGWIPLLLAPPFAVLMLMFRGHLFSALHGTTGRSRRFREHRMD